MRITTLKKDDNKQITDFLTIYNNAFKSRENSLSINPFTEMRIEDFYKVVSQEKRIFYVAYDGDEMLGGLCCEIKNNSIKKSYISYVCVEPSHQGKGVASLLFRHVHDLCIKEGCEFSELDVGGVWKSTINLYKHVGYMVAGIFAHLPNTYPLLKMIKPFPPNINWHFKFKLRLKLFISKIKFHILFKNDSSPKLLHKILYSHR